MAPTKGIFLFLFFSLVTASLSTYACFGVGIFTTRTVYSPWDTIRIAKQGNKQMKSDEQKKIDELLKLASKVYQIKMEYRKMDSVCEIALQSATRIKYRSGQGNALARKGVANKYLGKLNAAKDNHLAALEIFKELKDSSSMAKCYSNLGIAEKEMGNFPEAFKLHFTALKLAEHIKDEDGIARAHMNLGLMYKFQTQFDEALKSYRVSESIFARLKDTLQLTKVIENKIAIFIKKSWIDSAIRQNEEIIRMISSGKAHRRVEGGQLNSIAIHRQIAQLAEKKGDTAMARKHRLEEFRLAKESIGPVTKSGNKSLESRSLVVLASAYHHFGFIDSARQCVLKSIQILEPLKNLVYLKGNYDHMAIVDSMLAEDKSQTMEARLGYSREAQKYLRLAEITKYKQLNEENYKQLQDLKLQYETEKKDKEILLLNKDNALKTYDLNQKKVALQLAKLKEEKNYNEIELLNKSQELQTLSLIKARSEIHAKTLDDKAKAALLEISEKDKILKDTQLSDEVFLRNTIIAGSLFALLVGYLLFNRLRLQRQIEYQQSILNQRKQLSADLHDDVGATLSSISIYTEAIKNKLKNDEPQKVMELVNKIGENARETISTLGDIVWNINPQNDSAEMLFNRMESTATMLLSAQNTLLEFEADPKLSDFDFSLEAKQNLYLIFKETINNTLKYAQATQVKIGIKKTDGNFEMAISDNGKGFDSSKESEGNGLKNMKRRVENFGGKFMLASSSAGTSTMVQIPVVALEKI